MSGEQNVKQESVVRRTLFDYVGSDYLDLNLKIGSPSESQLKKSCEVLKKATIHRLDQADAHLLFEYGPEAGDSLFLQELAKFLSEEYHSTVDVNNIIATAGATQGLNLLSHLLFTSGDLVFVEDPTYFVAIKMLQQDAGFKCVPTAMDAEGIIPEELERNIQAHLSSQSKEINERNPFWSMLYLMPTFHNPTGVSLTPDRCRKIVHIARKYNLLVICDDVYNLLYFSQDTPDKRLFAYDDPTDPDYKGNVVSNGSFSKIFGPGIRLGWQELPPKMKNIILKSGLVMSGGAFNHTTSGLMTSILSLGLLRDLVVDERKVYKERRETVCGVLQQKLPTATFKIPQGGYFLWVKLPEPLKALDLIKRCEKEVKISFFPGYLASPTSQFDDYIRISFAHYEVEALASGVEKVAQVANSMLLESQ